MTDSLSSGRKLVTWILAGAMIPVEADAAIVRGEQQLDRGSANEWTSPIAQIPMPRPAGRDSCRP